MIKFPTFMASPPILFTQTPKFFYPGPTAMEAILFIKLKLMLMDILEFYTSGFFSLLPKNT